MRLRLLIEPQFGATFEQQLAIAAAAERLGFDALMRSDHYLNTGPSNGLPGPTDAWVTLGALARETVSIRLGTLMTSAHFRAPGPLALAVAQVDNMSAGRVEFGLGAGWYEREHEAFGLPFPAIPERFDRLEEQLEIITGLWQTPEAETFSFSGSHYRLIDCPGLPKATQTPGPPIIVGGYGRRRTPELAARFAAEFNVSLVAPDIVAAQFGRARQACEAHGRDPSSMVYSTGTTVCIAETRAAALRKVARAGLEVAEVEALGFIGEPAALLRHLETYREVGAERCYLRLLDLDDIEQLELIAAEVMPAVAA